VDGVTYVRATAGGDDLLPGARVRARVVRARQYDLDAEVVA